MKVVGLEIFKIRDFFGFPLKIRNRIKKMIKNIKIASTIFLLYEAVVQLSEIA